MNCVVSWRPTSIPNSLPVSWRSSSLICAAAPLVRLMRWRLLQTKRAIRAAATRYVPSPEFRLRMEQSIRAKSKRRWFDVRLPRLALAAVAAVLLIASVTLWVNHSGRERELTEIADLHVTALASSNPVDVVSTDKHTVKPWFAGKLPFSFNLPELQNSGFTLVGGRVAYFEHSSGAQLLFNLRKHQLSVFIFKGGAARISLSQGNGHFLPGLPSKLRHGVRVGCATSSSVTRLHPTCTR